MAILNNFDIKMAILNNCDIKMAILHNFDISVDVINNCVKSKAILRKVHEYDYFVINMWLLLII